jgi:FkbM family methyltransferase
MYGRVKATGTAMLTSDDVIWGYRYILGREPEDPAIIESHAKTFTSVQTFRAALLKSDEFARGLEQFTQKRWVAAPVMGDTRLLWINLADRFVSLGCLQDSYERMETDFLRRVLKAGDTFLDIGANVGWFSILASTIVGAEGAIHAFEPRPEIASYLQRSVELNDLGAMITVHTIGLSNQPGTETLVWNEDSDNSGTATFGRDEDWLGFTKQSIEVRRFDDLGIAGVDVVKIDVEGAEFLAMQGAAAMLSRDKPIILSEVLPSQLERVSRCSGDDYFKFLEDLGYTGYIVDETRCGERVTGFPDPWYKPLVNIAFFPVDKPAPSLFHPPD